MAILAPLECGSGATAFIRGSGAPALNDPVNPVHPVKISSASFAPSAVKKPKGQDHGRCFFRNIRNPALFSSQ